MSSTSVYNRVEVTWIDSCHVSKGWDTPDNYADDLKPSQCQTCGYLIVQDNSRIVVALSAWGGEIADCMVIPRACVQSITRLEPDTTELLT